MFNSLLLFRNLAYKVDQKFVERYIRLQLTSNGETSKHDRTLIKQNEYAINNSKNMKKNSY